MGVGKEGRLAQLVERALCMREVKGSKPLSSKVLRDVCSGSSVGQSNLLFVLFRTGITNRSQVQILSGAKYLIL